MGKGKVYKVFRVESDGDERLIFASSNISAAIEAAREYLEYKPSPTEITQLKLFFKSKPEEFYSFTVGDKTVKMILVFNNKE